MGVRLVHIDDAGSIHTTVAFGHTSFMDDNFSHNRVNLASAKFGAEVIYATDEFFADKSRLIADIDPIFIEGKYDENGKLIVWNTISSLSHLSLYCGNSRNFES